MRKVRCVETKMVFENAEEAGKWVGLTAIAIRSACNGAHDKAKGLTFEYVFEKKKREPKVRIEQEALFKDTKELKEITKEYSTDKKSGSVILSKMNKIIRYVKGENK